MAVQGEGSFLILVAEDDAADRLLLKDAFDELDLNVRLAFVENGEELLNYLRQGGPPQGGTHQHPALILLDLGMPRVGGMAALRSMRADPLLRILPVIVLSTSKDEEEIARTYAEGSNAYMTKPVTPKAMLEKMESLSHCWLRETKLPNLTRYIGAA